MNFTLSLPLLGSIDADSGVIRGVSVITEGPALGHGVMIDATSLATTKEAAETYRGGLKVKMNHYSGADAIVGVLRDFRIDGTQLRADLHTLKNSPHRALVLEMAETMPDSFGLSISFSGSVDEEDGIKFARCLEIYSCDIVDQPAANPTGLFSKPVDITKEPMSEPIIAELTAKHEAAAAKAVENFQALQAKTAELDSLKVAFDMLTADVTALRTAAVEAKAKLDEYQAKETEKINAEATRQLAASGHPQLDVSGEVSNQQQPKNKEELWAEYNKLPISEQTAFYKKHRSTLRS